MTAATALIVLWSLAPAGAGTFWSEPSAAFVSDRGLVVFRVETANTPQSWARGLMERWRLDPDAGMLFLYPDEQPRSFWMKNTPIYLDIIFMDSRGVVRRVHKRAEPFDLTPIPSGPPSRFVLEVNGGMADRWGIEPGLRAFFGPLVFPAMP